MGDTWKEKILDYEIETRGLIRPVASDDQVPLEKKRFSITRLKRNAFI